MSSGLDLTRTDDLRPAIDRSSGNGTQMMGDPLVRLILILNVVFLPILVPRGPGNSVPADLPALALVVVGAAVLWRAGTPIRLPLGLSYTLILVGGLLGTAQAIAPTVALLATLIDLYLFIWFVVLVNAMTLLGRDAIRIVAMTWVSTATMVGLLGVIGSILGYEHAPSLLGYDFVDRYERFYGPLRDPNMAGSYLAVSLFVLAASPWPRRWATKLLFALPLIAAIQATRSNTALFALSAGIVVALAVAAIRSRRSAVGAAFAVTACGLLLFAFAPASVVDAPATVARSLGESDAFSGSLGRFDSSLGGRVGRIHEALLLFGPDVMLGIGPSATDETLATMDADILGELHNDYVAAIIERGLLGIIGVGVLMAVPLLTSVLLGGRSEASRAGWRTAALVGGVACVIVTALALEALHFRHVWMLFAVVFALRLSEPGSAQGGLGGKRYAI